MQQLGIRQRPRVRRAHTIEHLLLALRLIHRKVRIALKFADRLRRRRTLVDKANDLLSSSSIFFRQSEMSIQFPFVQRSMPSFRLAAGYLFLQ